MRDVPDHIVPTDYYRSGHPVRRDEPMVKSPDVIERMRVAGKVAAEVLAVTGAAVAPGVTTEELDRIAHQAYVDRGAYPSTLNYHGYPKSICTSVNEVICHGIPDDRPLEEGDIVNIDVTAYLDGVHGDCNATFYAGEVDAGQPAARGGDPPVPGSGHRRRATGPPISDIGRAIETHAHAHGYGVVRTFVGHGIGEQFHIAPERPALLHARRVHDHGTGHDLHRRAHDHHGRLAGEDVGQRLDGGDPRRPAHRSVRAHPPRDRRRRRGPHPVEPCDLVQLGGILPKAGVDAQPGRAGHVLRAVIEEDDVFRLGAERGQHRW